MRVYLLCGMIAATIGTSLHVILAALIAKEVPSGLLIVSLAYNWAWTVTRNEVWRDLRKK